MSFVIAGFFVLTTGRRVLTELSLSSGDNVTICHMLYSTTVVCSQQSARLLAEIHMYSPVGDAPLPDNTVAFVVAKAHIPAERIGGIVLLDALHFSPMPGNPSDENYNANLPDFSNPLVLALGTVAADHEESPGGPLTFPVSLLEYIHGGVRESTVQLRFFPFFWRSFLMLCYK